MNPFSATLHEHLKARGITQRDLAKRAALTEAAISKILQGRNRPRPETLERIINAVAGGDPAETELRELLWDSWSGRDTRFPLDPLLRSRLDQLRAEVSAILMARELPFEDRTSPGSAVADFLTGGPAQDSPRIGIKCIADANRDGISRLAMRLIGGAHLGRLDCLLACFLTIPDGLDRLFEFLEDSCVLVVDLRTLPKALDRVIDLDPVMVWLPRRLLPAPDTALGQELQGPRRLRQWLLSTAMMRPPG